MTQYDRLTKLLKASFPTAVLEAFSIEEGVEAVAWDGVEPYLSYYDGDEKVRRDLPEDEGVDRIFDSLWELFEGEPPTVYSR